MSVGHRSCSAVSFFWCVPMEALPNSLSMEETKAGPGGSIRALSTWLPECITSEVFTNISSGVQRQSSFSKEATGWGELCLSHSKWIFPYSLIPGSISFQGHFPGLAELLSPTYPGLHAVLSQAESGADNTFFQQEVPPFSVVCGRVEGR